MVLINYVCITMIAKGSNSTEIKWEKNSIMAALVLSLSDIQAPLTAAVLHELIVGFQNST